MQLVLTRNMQQALQSVIDDPGFCSTLKEEAEQAVNAPLDQEYGVSLSLLQELSRILSRRTEKRVWFHELVRGSSVYVEPKPEEDLEEKAAREALMEQFRVEQQEKEYVDMVRSVVTSENDKFVLGIRPDDIRETKGHLAAIVNILVSMAAVAFAVYMATRTMTPDVGMRAFWSMTGAALIGIVESVLYINYARRSLTPSTKISKRKAKKK